MTIRNYTFFSPKGTEFPVTANSDAKLYMLLSNKDYSQFLIRHWSEPVLTGLNKIYTDTSVLIGGRYFELNQENVSLKANSVNYIHANVDPSNISNPVTLSVETANNSNKNDINSGNGVLKHIIDIITTDATKVTKSETPEQVQLDITTNKITTDSLEMKKFADSYIAIFSNVGDTITITAPWDCIADVRISYHGWGFSGGEWEIGVDGSNGVTKTYEATGYTNGHNSQAIAMPTDAGFTGLKKGQQYTFNKRDVSGRGGGSARPKITVKLYKN